MCVLLPVDVEGPVDMEKELEEDGWMAVKEATKSLVTNCLHP